MVDMRDIERQIDLLLSPVGPESGDVLDRLRTWEAWLETLKCDDLPSVHAFASDCFGSLGEFDPENRYLAALLEIYRSIGSCCPDEFLALANATHFRTPFYLTAGEICSSQAYQWLIAVRRDPCLSLRDIQFIDISINHCTFDFNED